MLTVFCVEIKEAVVAAQGAWAARTAMVKKTSIENKSLGNGDYFVIVASSSYPLWGSLRIKLQWLLQRKHRIKVDLCIRLSVLW